MAEVLPAKASSDQLANAWYVHVESYLPKQSSPLNSKRAYLPEQKCSGASYRVLLAAACCCTTSTRACIAVQKAFREGACVEAARDERVWRRFEIYAVGRRRGSVESEQQV